jgi:DNA-binding NarL/FixJ family response regulator
MNVFPTRNDALRDSGQWAKVAFRLRLSSREVDIARLLVADKKESAIAASLGISMATVHSRVRRMYSKLDVSSRTALAVRLCQELSDQRCAECEHRAGVSLPLRKAA